jgi:hypothetical protein
MEKDWYNAVSVEIAFMFRDPILNYDWIGETNDYLIRQSEGYILWIHNFDDFDKTFSDGKIEMLLHLFI